MNKIFRRWKHRPVTVVRATMHVGSVFQLRCTYFKNKITRRLYGNVCGIWYPLFDLEKPKEHKLYSRFISGISGQLLIAGNLLDEN